MTAALTFAEVIDVNRRRCARWHDPDTDAWTGADWSNAMLGEVGETAEAVLETLAHLTAAAGKAGNDVKKLRRHETRTSPLTDPDRADLLTAVGHEIADTILYTLLLGDHYGIDVPRAVVEKLNAVSERQGFPERLAEELSR